MHLMNTPRNFDVVLTENLFGDILSDEAAVITGSLGMLPSATIGGQVNLYEPVHGSAPDIAGKGLANPLGAILTAAMLLRHSAKLEQDAQAVETSVRKVLEQGYRTADLARGQTSKMTVSTQEMGKHVHHALNENIDCQPGDARSLSVAAPSAQRQSERSWQGVKARRCQQHQNTL